MTARFLVGDVFDRLAELETGSVDLVITSPPFLALRSYLPADHPEKSKEIGSETTPAAFLDVMLAVMAELRRVTAAHGSVCLELGDTYAGSGGAGGDYAEHGLRAGQPAFDGSGRRTEVGSRFGADPKDPGRSSRRTGGRSWPLNKSKALIPELFRVALAYGRNPLRAPLSARELLAWVESQVEQRPDIQVPELLDLMRGFLDRFEEAGPYREYERWLVRNVVTWCRPNPPVGALGDKWRPATSDVVVAATSSKRYWDDLATRRPWSPDDYDRPNLRGMGEGPKDRGRARNHSDHTTSKSGAPLLDYWEIPPTGYSGSHYAVYPPALVEPLVKAMCPQKVCRTCGQPSRRIVDEGEIIGSHKWNRHGTNSAVGVEPLKDVERPHYSTRSTLGWTDCGHDNWRPGLILDPFAGSGTTLLVATGHGHDAVGIDLDERNAELALERVGPFLLEVVV